MQHRLEQANVLDQLQHTAEMADFVAKSKISNSHMDLMTPNLGQHIDDYHHDLHDDILPNFNLINGHAHGLLGHSLLDGGLNLLGSDSHNDINNFANLADIAAHTTLNEYGDEPGHSQGDSHEDDAARLVEQLHSTDLMAHSEIHDPVDATPMDADESNAENREISSSKPPHLHSPHILRSLDFGGADPVSIADHATYSLSPLAKQISNEATKVTAQNLFQKFSAMDDNLIHTVNQPEAGGSHDAVTAAVTGAVRRHQQNRHHQKKEKPAVGKQASANSDKRNLDNIREKKQRELEEMLHPTVTNTTNNKTANISIKQKKNIIESLNSDLQNEKQASSIKRTIKKLDEVIDVLKSQPTVRSTIPMHSKRRKTKKTRKNKKTHYKKGSKNQAAERSQLPNKYKDHKKRTKPPTVNSTSSENSTTEGATQDQNATDNKETRNLTRNTSNSTIDNDTKPVKTVDENNLQYQASKMKKLNISLEIQKKYINYKHMVNLLRGQSRSVSTLGPSGNFTAVEKEVQVAEGKAKKKTVALTEATRLSRNPKPTGDNRLLFDSTKNVSLSLPTVASTTKSWYSTNKLQHSSKKKIREFNKTNKTDLKITINSTAEKTLLNTKHELDDLREEIKVRYEKYKKLKSKLRDQAKSAIKLEPDFGKDLINITKNLVKEQTKSLTAVSENFTPGKQGVVRGVISHPESADGLKNLTHLVNNIDNDVMKRSHTIDYNNNNNDDIQTERHPTPAWVIEVE